VAGLRCPAWHDHAHVRAAIKAQVDTLAFAHNRGLYQQPGEDIAQILIRAAPEGTGPGRA